MGFAGIPGAGEGGDRFRARVPMGAHVAHALQAFAPGAVHEDMGSPQPTDHERPSEAPAADIFQELEIALDAFPHLAAVLATGGAALRSELVEFAMAVRWKRAPRIKRSLVARVYLNEDEVPDMAIVRDISESGVCLWVDRGMPIDTATSLVMEIKVPGTREYVAVTAELVRVVNPQARRGMELAFKFVTPSPMLSRLLSALT